MITLKTLPEATAQQVFDQVAKHLLTQKTRSKNGSACAYHSPNGLKCAAGCLIADDEYDREMDAGPGDTYWMDLVHLKLVPDAHMSLIDALQNVHDNFIPDEWKRELRVIAYNRNLNTEVLDG